MPLLVKLLGISAVLGALPALGYSGLQAFTREGWRCWSHFIVLLVATLVIGVTLAGEPLVAQVLALPLFLAAVGALSAERGWRRIFPAAIGAFALVLLDGGLAALPGF